MGRIMERVSLWSWLAAVVLAGHLMSLLLWPQQTAEAKPLGAVREFDVTLKAPDLIVPNNFAVNVGDTIRFRVKNEGPAPHNLHIGGNGVDVESPLWQAGTSAVWEYAFTRPGVYAIYCSVASRGMPPGIQHRHVGPMEGVIVVTESGTADLASWQARAVPLSAVGGSGVTGTAYLQPRADGSTGVRVDAAGLKAGSSYFFNVRRNSSDCFGGQLGNPSAATRAMGTSAMLLQTHPGSLSNAYSVALFEGSGAPGTVVACGDQGRAVLGVGATTTSPATPAALPRTGEADIRSLVLAALAAGGLALGLSVLARRRAV